MKTQKEAGKAEIALLVAVALAAGAAGVWSELQAAGADVTRVVSSHIYAAAGNADFTINTQPGGQIWVNGNAWVGSGQLSVTDWNASGSIDAPNGQSPHPPSSSGSATAAGTLFDGNSWTWTPVTVDVSISVQATTSDWRGDYSSKFNNHRLVVQDNNWNGLNDPRAARVHEIGSEAWTPSGGSVSVSVNGTPFAGGSGGSGSYVERNTHTVTK